MSNAGAASAAVVLLTRAFSPGFLSAQSSSPVTVRPGGGLVTGVLLTPTRREFTISATACEVDTGGLPAKVGSFVQETQLVGDTVILFIEEWREPDSPTLDTTALDRRTLAPLWSHVHFQENASASWEFRGRRVLWSVLQPDGETESLDSTLSEQAFLAGTTNLLLGVTPRLYLPNARIVYSFIDIAGGPGKPSTFASYATAARVTGSESVRLPNGTRVDTWIVTTAPDGRTYWVDKRSYEVLMWHVPEYESICATTYARSSP